MIRTLIAASLILGAGGAYAQGVPSYDVGTASAARTLGATATPGYAYGPARPIYHHDVETTGSIAIPHRDHQTVMGLPVPGTY